MNELMTNLLKLQSLDFSETKNENTAAQIAEWRGKIPAQILGHYDRLVARGKRGLAAVRNQVCSGCHMRQPLGVLMTLKHGTDIQLCDSCGRYLYLADEAISAPIPEVKAKASRRKKAVAAAA